MLRWTDARMERLIAALLRTGVLLSTGLVLAGAAVFLARHAGDRADFSAFQGEPAALRSLAALARGVLALEGSALIMLGLLVLIATPVARVTFSVLAFAAQRDGLYVVVTLIVLAVLGVSLLGVVP